ncbi:hypothetical protein PSP20601_04904 [Pandoraea sputorum]|nr:hypothetical protein PSP20601_04904 [Pandoraea sputorum]
MNVSPTFEANAKTAKVVKPRMSTLDNPAEFAQATAVFCPAPGEHRFDAALAKPLTMRLGIVATVCVDDFGLQKRLAAHAANGWDRVDERQQLGDVVAVRAGQHCADGDAICIDEDVMLGTWSRAIRGVRARFLPASRNLSSSSWCNLIHTPAFCQSRKRLQQVGPEPNPNLVDRSHQRIPVLNTNRMPISAARFETGSRPGYFWRRGFGGGSKGSISAHSSSSMIGVPIPSVPVIQMAKVNSLPKRLTAPLGSF